MSYSGAGLYDDDTAADVRARYRESIGDGIPGEAATDALIAEWGDALDDADERCAFWLALAETQWEAGRLEARVRDRALGLIATGEDLARFAHDERLYVRRRGVLETLERRLRSPQRAPTRIRQAFRSVSPVAVGDVFWFAMGRRRVLMRCVAISGDERDNYPTVEVLDWGGETVPDDLETLEARQALPWPNGDRRADLLCLVRYARDPDPSDQIDVVATGTPIRRPRTLPALMVPWTDLPESLARDFGL